MSFLFNEIFYLPLLNLLVAIYGLAVSDLGIAIIILTLIIRLVLLPLFYKSTKDQTIIQKYVTPKIKTIQEKYKDNKEQQVKEMMAVYKEHKVSPFSGFLLLLVQLPILFALYRVFMRDFSSDLSEHLYSFVAAPEIIHTTFLGIIELSNSNIWLVLLAAVFQYLQSRLLFNINKKDKKGGSDGSMGIAEKVGKNMVVLGPILTIIILSQMPSAVALYWMTTSVFSVGQQIVINKRLKNNGTREAAAGNTD